MLSCLAIGKDVTKYMDDGDVENEHDKRKIAAPCSIMNI